VKVAFWGNVSEKSRVSSNLAAISIASVIRFPYTIVVLENHLSYNNLGCAYLGKPQAEMVQEVGTNYYEGGGIEGLLRKIYREETTSDILRPYLKEIIHNHLYYIPQSRVIRSDLFDYEFNHCIEPFFQLMENFADISFVDTANGNNLSSKTILQEADIIVVNLCRDPNILDDFFHNYVYLISKAVFLVNNYSAHDAISSKLISLRYEIPIDSVIVIPYCETFENAFLLGSVVEFISGNYGCSKEDPNYAYIHAIKKASYMIIKKSELLHRYQEKKKNKENETNREQPQKGISMDEVGTGTAN
jgi:hypothetical protein